MNFVPPEFSMAPVAGQVRALLYDETNAVYRVLAAAVDGIRARGVRVGGLLQRAGERQANGKPSLWLEDIGTGAVLRLDEQRGRGAQACILDTGALAQGAYALRQAVEARCEVIVVSRFGSVEAEGGGLRAEIAEAVCSGAVVIIPVREPRLADLEAFLGGAPTVLPASADEIADWAFRAVVLA